MSRPVGVAGLSHLGLVAAASIAAKGFHVIAFDPDKDLIDDLNRTVLPVVEPGLSDLVAANRQQLFFTTDAGQLVRCGVVYLARDVPIDYGGVSDLSAIESLLDAVDSNLSKEAVLVIHSQVPPGFTRQYIRPGRPLYCQVETLVFGRAVERALNPRRLIVGCADPGLPLPAPYDALLAAFQCPVHAMGYESAELCKIAINVCLVATISATNTMAELCENVGGDWSEIVSALRSDPRIGEDAYLTPGLGIAGGNLERDLATVRRLARETGGDDRVVTAWLDHSRHRRDWVLRTLHGHVLAKTKDPVVAILGLAYKADTASTTNAPALALIENLKNCDLRVYDPVVPVNGLGHPGAVEATSALEACEGANAVAIMTPWAEFRDLVPGDLAARLSGRTVVDPYLVLDGTACRQAGLDHFTLGRPPGAPSDPNDDLPC
jgi:UDPglucose 6-dehydrogenase